MQRIMPSNHGGEFSGWLRRRRSALSSFLPSAVMRFPHWVLPIFWERRCRLPGRQVAVVGPEKPVARQPGGLLTSVHWGGMIVQASRKGVGFDLARDMESCVLLHRRHGTGGGSQQPRIISGRKSCSGSVSVGTARR